jgi:antirestriction protein ArdC
MQASDLYEKVTNQIIADLEKGAVPWVKPWKGGNSGGIMPINAALARPTQTATRAQKGSTTGTTSSF